MEIIIRRDDAECGITAADIVAAYVAPGHPLTLGLATGSTPLSTYRELIRRHEAGELSFSSARAFLLDEYVGLPRDHEQSYYSTIRREFTSHIDIPDAAVASPNGTAERPDLAGKSYDAAIAEAGGVDVQILGIGTDGHIGFNEPGSSLTSGTRIKTLRASTIEDNARFFDSAEEVPHHVLTQGLGTISRARHIVFLAIGGNKAAAVAAMAEGPVSAMCPASVLQMHPHVTAIVDEAAASQLAGADYYRFAEQEKPQWQGF